MYRKVEKELDKVVDKSQVGTPISDNEETAITKETIEKEKSYVPPPPYKPPIPYLQRLAKTKNEEDITRIPFYAKFLKEILSNKKKLEDDDTVALTTECSAIIQNNMPPKLKDTSSFYFPCVIGKFVINKLNLGDFRPMRTSLKLANLSFKYPIGMLENIPVCIGQFYIPMNFIVMDISEDSNIPIILGMPFLATTGVIIDVKRGKLTFKVGQEKIEFTLSQFLKAPTIAGACYFIDIIDECIKELASVKPPTTMLVELPATKMVEEDEAKYYHPYVEYNLRECIALTPNLMPSPKEQSIELNKLPKNLRYEFLDEQLDRPIIVNIDIHRDETEKLLVVLRKYHTTLGYNISNLKGVIPSMCMHKIMLEEDSKTLREH
ncbi:uncharacterized protein LOC127129918 [Lathyrus oleraceus]|uniref:uncharacterized protein LOC127129918 n=1 Tax=Pisum sativum TaxID=3888 RepID=UPI0021D31135|nr:uncharacterized protein LOC127129918 [Pisum sativum]